MKVLCSLKCWEWQTQWHSVTSQTWISNNTIARAPSLALSSLIHMPHPHCIGSNKEHQNHVLLIHDTSNVVGGYQWGTKYLQILYHKVKIYLLMFCKRLKKKLIPFCKTLPDEISKKKGCRNLRSPPTYCMINKTVVWCFHREYHISLVTGKFMWHLLCWTAMGIFSKTVPLII